MQESLRAYRCACVHSDVCTVCMGMCMCVCVYVCVLEPTHQSGSMYMCVYVCMCMYVRVCTHVCMFACVLGRFVYICLYVERCRTESGFSLHWSSHCMLQH